LTLPKVVKEWSLRSLQLKFIKIGTKLVRHARRLVFQLALRLRQASRYSLPF
jgi:hypothetical protein